MANVNKYFAKRLNPQAILNSIKNMYINKCYNIWMNYGYFEGLSDELYPIREQLEFIMRQFWSVGTCAAIKVKALDELAFCPYAASAWNLYDSPVKAQPIRLRDAKFIPLKELKCNKDIVIGFAMRNHKPIREIVDYYIERIAQVEAVIRTNLELHKMPFVITCEESDKGAFQDLVDKILNNEVVVFTELENTTLVKAINTATPFIIDKLRAYSIQLWNELLTYFGIENGGSVQKATTMLLDEVNSDNALTNFNQDQFSICINEWCELINKAFNKQLVFKLRVNKAVENEQSRNRSDGEVESGFDRQGQRKEQKQDD